MIYRMQQYMPIHVFQSFTYFKYESLSDDITFPMNENRNGIVMQECHYRSRTNEIPNMIHRLGSLHVSWELCNNKFEMAIFRTLI